MPRKKTRLDGECQRWVIEPLKKEYKEVSVRASDLWSYMNCAYKAKYAPPKPSTQDYYRIWHQINAVCQTFLANWSDISFLYEREFERKQLKKYINIVEQQLASKYLFVTNEHSLWLEVEMGDYLVSLTGTPDLIMQDPERQKEKWRGTIIVDLKTSWSERDEDIKANNRQKYIYPFLWNKSYPSHEVNYFEYFLMTKHAEPRFYSYWYEVDNDMLSEKLQRLLKNYIKNIQWKPEATKWIQCRWCPLYDLCPARNEDPF